MALELGPRYPGPGPLCRAAEGTGLLQPAAAASPLINHTLASHHSRQSLRKTTAD